MRELRSCDFCDGDALGAFEVVPGELSPTETEQRRIVLCPNCRDTLETVLEPFLTRLGVEGGVGDDNADDVTTPAATAESSTERETDETGAVVGSDDDRETSAQPASVDSGARGEGITIGRGDDETRSNESEAEETKGEELEVGVRGDEGSEVDEGSGIDEGEDKGSGVDEGENEDSEGGETDENVSVANDPGDDPDQFRKVMRLLANREFPVERSEFALLAASAYDLEDDHVARIVDRAVERGVLVDDEGTLKKA